LLADRLGIALRRVCSGGRLTLSLGEHALNDWIGENALVCWQTTPAPWEAESTLIGQLNLPLNLDQNRDNPFHRVLERARARTRAQAKALPILPA
jgi:hypothetical protein